MSWNDAQDFLRKLQVLLPSTTEVGLPTEAQWEYACRAGTGTPFSFGAQITPEQVNFDGNFPYAGGKKGLDRGKTVPVKSLPANRWGLYEMHGNVSEWCADGPREYTAEPQEDPRGQATGVSLRALRGGSWFSFGKDVRSAGRDGYEPDYRSRYTGFRLLISAA